LAGRKTPPSREKAPRKELLITSPIARRKIWNPFPASRRIIPIVPPVNLSLPLTRSVAKQKMNVARKTMPTRVGGKSLNLGAWIFAIALFVPRSRGFVANRSPVSPTVTKVAAHAGDQLGLLSFDLDDTLFHTGKVVRAANDVMIEAMQERGCEELALPEYLDTTRSVRKALSAPITYRVLRELAIRTSFEQSKVFQSAGKNVDAYVQDCYKVWEKERHLAAERFIFEDAVRTLEQLRSLYPDACFAAITNGAGNPLMMPNTLAPFFDFRVSGEDPDVFPNRKPHAYIYEYSLEKYQQLSGSNSKGTWCHVGDCLANDVGASAACGAKAIWMCLSDDDDTAAARLLDPKVYPEWSTASKEEIEKRIREVEAGMSKVTAKIGTLSELPDALADILTGATVVK
jgi:FMN phosphatase YigB (HAD superfamily)